MSHLLSLMPGLFCVGFCSCSSEVPEQWCCQIWNYINLTIVFLTICNVVQRAIRHPFHLNSIVSYPQVHHSNHGQENDRKRNVHQWREDNMCQTSSSPSWPQYENWPQMWLWLGGFKKETSEEFEPTHHSSSHVKPSFFLFKVSCIKEDSGSWSLLKCTLAKQIILV